MSHYAKNLLIFAAFTLGFTLITAMSAWASNPDVNALKFGLDPLTDPTLRAVWEPEKAKLLAIRPQS